MKNLVTIVCLFVFLYTNNLMSQDDGLKPKLAKSQNEISVNGGITSSTISGSDDGLEFTENLNLSVIYGTPLNEDIKFYFGLEYLKLGSENNRSYNDTWGQTTTNEIFSYSTFSHINLPLNVGYVINSDKLQIIPKVGANINYLFAVKYFSRIKSVGPNGTEVQEMTKDATSEEIDDQVHRFGLLLNIAIDFRYEINKQFQVKFEPRYGTSVITIAKESRFSAKHDFIGLNLGVVYNF